MARPFTNIKNYEKSMREVEADPILKLSKLEAYGRILRGIEKEHKKAKEKMDLLSKKWDVIINLIFEEKDKFSVKVG